MKVGVGRDGIRWMSLVDAMGYVVMLCIARGP